MPGRKSKKKPFIPPVYLERALEEGKRYPDSGLLNAYSKHRDYDNLWDMRDKTYVRCAVLPTEEVERIKAELYYYAVHIGFLDKDSQTLALTWK